MNINEFLKQYIDLPKWRGKIFTADETTCYIDGLHEGSKVMQDENERLSKRVLELQSDVSNLKLYIEKMKSCYNCKYYNAGSTKCFTGIPYNSKGCLKHWVLR